MDGEGASICVTLLHGAMVSRGDGGGCLKQVEDMKYDAELMARGIPKERIRLYGLVFDGKRVLIGE